MKDLFSTQYEIHSISCSTCAQHSHSHIGKENSIYIYIHINIRIYEDMYIYAKYINKSVTFIPVYIHIYVIMYIHIHI